jgi:hypothetical protein
MKSKLLAGTLFLAWSVFCLLTGYNLGDMRMLSVAGHARSAGTKAAMDKYLWTAVAIESNYFVLSNEVGTLRVQMEGYEITDAAKARTFLDSFESKELFILPTSANEGIISARIYQYGSPLEGRLSEFGISALATKF